MLKQYFATSELDFSGNPDTRPALEMHLISEDTAKQLHDYTVLEFEGDSLKNAYYQSSENLPEVEATINENLANYVKQNTLTPLTSPENKQWHLNIDENGKSKLGGKAPEGFVFPPARFASGHQYIGTISKYEEAFPYLNFDLHLIYPVCLDYHPPLFLDIADPLKPTLLDLDEAETLQLCWPTPGQTYLAEVRHEGLQDEIEEAKDIKEAFKDNKTLEFEEIAISFDKQQKSTVWGQAGFPSWVQYPEIPYCPNTEKPMQFLCSIGFHHTGFKGPKAVPSDLKLPEGSPHASCVEYMQFWQDGDLFVFYSPEGKTMCLFPQNT